MGAVTPSLIIGTPGFSADDLIELQRESDSLVGAIVVRTLDELSECLANHPYSFVLCLYDVSAGSDMPMDSLSLVSQKLPGVPFVVVGKDLSIAHALDLMAAGAADCLAADDDRSLDEVLRHATGPYRHLRTVPRSQPKIYDINTVFHALGEGVVVLDTNLNICTFNPAFLAHTGYQADDLTGAPLFRLDFGDAKDHLEACAQTAGEWRGEINIGRKDGSVYPAWAVMSSITGGPAQQTPDGFVLLVSDMTDRMQLDQDIRHQASFDALTELPNRSLLQDRVTQALANAKRNGTRVAAMFIDLDHFKDINDTWGHATGDAMLVEAAIRMQACVRESDTVARIGGDEFAVILADLGEDYFADKVASKISGALERPFILQGAAL